MAYASVEGSVVTAELRRSAGPVLGAALLGGSILGMIGAAVGALVGIVPSVLHLVRRSAR